MNGFGLLGCFISGWFKGPGLWTMKCPGGDEQVWIFESKSGTNRTKKFSQTKKKRPKKGKSLLVTSMRTCPFWGWLTWPTQRLGIKFGRSRLAINKPHDAAQRRLPTENGSLPRFWELHKKLGECYQADLQMASVTWRSLEEFSEQGDVWVSLHLPPKETWRIKRGN